MTWLVAERAAEEWGVEVLGRVLIQRAELSEVAGRHHIDDKPMRIRQCEQLIALK